MRVVVRDLPRDLEAIDAICSQEADVFGVRRIDVGVHPSDFARIFSQAQEVPEDDSRRHRVWPDPRVSPGFMVIRTMHDEFTRAPITEAGFYEIVEGNDLRVAWMAPGLEVAMGDQVMWRGPIPVPDSLGGEVWARST